jgi:glycosyltransferase involved in cell wall biosynthesis
VYLLNNPIKAKTLAEAGRQLVEQKYDVENWIQQIENIYWSVLNERSKRDSFRLTVAG